MQPLVIARTVRGIATLSQGSWRQRTRPAGSPSNRALRTDRDHDRFARPVLHHRRKHRVTGCRLESLLRACRQAPGVQAVVLDPLRDGVAQVGSGYGVYAQRFAFAHTHDGGRMK